MTWKQSKKTPSHDHLQAQNITFQPQLALHRAYSEAHLWHLQRACSHADI